MTDVHSRKASDSARKEEPAVSQRASQHPSSGASQGASPAASSTADTGGSSDVEQGASRSIMDVFVFDAFGSPALFWGCVAIAGMLTYVDNWLLGGGLRFPVFMLAVVVFGVVLIHSYRRRSGDGKDREER